LLSVMSALHKLAGFITQRKLGEPGWWGPRSCCLFHGAYYEVSQGSQMVLGFVVGGGSYLNLNGWAEPLSLSLARSLSIFSPHSFSISNAYCCIIAKAPRRSSSSSSSSSSAYLLELSQQNDLCKFFTTFLLSQRERQRQREIENTHESKHPRKPGQALNQAFTNSKTQYQ
jgi:hypothetical protein